MGKLRPPQFPGVPKPEDTYKRAVGKSLEDLAMLLEKREALEDDLRDIEEKIDSVQLAAQSMGRLCGIDPEQEHPELFPESAEPEVGFTDAIRGVFRADGMQRLYSPTHVRDRLREMGFPLSKYKNPLASIHTILVRLTEKAELKRMVIEGKIYYGMREAVEGHAATKMGAAAIQGERNEEK